MNKPWQKNLINIEPYVAGEQPKTNDIIKLNANENPYPPSPEVQKAIDSCSLSSLRLYPDPTSHKLNKAIADFPQEALFVMFKGIVLESKTDDIEKAIDLYKKATEIDPTLAQAQYHVGRYYNNKAVNLMNAEENANLNDAELSKVINPYCEQALPYLKKAVELDDTNSDAKRLLRWVEDRLSK